ncbi:MAG: helix-turn-helix transcriptional regulator [Azonexus sp.]|jgi:AraC-like DNA-binding protein|nr:helix-turn-helix transcriptional regulator [Azonexus sp.]
MAISTDPAIWPETRQGMTDWRVMNNRLADDDNPLRPVLGYAHNWPTDAPFSIPSHSHWRAQLVFAIQGVLRISTADAVWVASPQQAVWVSPGVAHAVTATGDFVLQTLYLHPSVKVNLPNGCCVIMVPPLLRELILHAVQMKQDYVPGGLDAMIVSIIPALLNSIDPEPLRLPLPVDRRLRTVIDALLADPANKHPLSFWASRVGASERTLLRHFIDETGMSYHEWRKRLRLVHAITLLANGNTVTATAYALGYDSPSSFVAMFHRALGSPPRRYLSLRKGRAESGG